MPRRVSLPSADDLFRPTEEAAEGAPKGSGKPRSVRAVPDDATETAPAQRRPSGRVRHDEKMTVYVTAEELLSIEHTRLTLRASHGLAVDRGRLVREALALVLAEYDANGADSALVRRLAEG
ncbi:hypothetical protein [Nocardioides sp. AX2bis]|uniref:hypothetical protein n=1 Tax=Nocardioides sp. AX2bis TaxID=2653157 RepID=UPI0012F07A8F|nr:hypothetical protein [Nocardioides sp. AX2bis]VXB62236.1 conserved hypothetical protein [Nocardioides sp. AX2bis]